MTTIAKFIPDLKFTPAADHDGLIQLEQDAGHGNKSRVLIHPLHVRLLAETFGASDTPAPSARQVVQQLQRRLLSLLERICDLSDYLRNYSDHKNADLTFECEKVKSLEQLANDYCDDFKSDWRAA